jgi:nucleoid-associated protein YgaU
MALFGKSFDEKVQSALEKVRGQFPGSDINAKVDDEVVTLTGRAADVQTKSKIMAAFNQAVETKNTINNLSVTQPAAASARPDSPLSAKAAPGLTTATEHRTHEVASGETLTHIAHRYYGDAAKFSKIFEANRDQLKDPDKIKVGQKLKIPV